MPEAELAGRMKGERRSFLLLVMAGLHTAFKVIEITKLSLLKIKKKPVPCRSYS